MPLFGRGGIVTHDMLGRARQDVWRELERADLATPELARVRVIRPWLELSERVGSYTPGDGGTIRVPAVSLGRFEEYRKNAPWTGVRDILRHEYAHALSEHHPHVVQRETFAATFGGPHDHRGPARPYAYVAHVSEYAATEPSEDFAETVMFYLRLGGRGAVRAYARRPGLYRKLCYVAAIPGWLPRR